MKLGTPHKKADPYELMIPEIKLDGSKYYKYALVYVDNVLVISCLPMKKMERIKCEFKLKGDKS